MRQQAPYACLLAYLEVDVVGEEEKPGLRALASAEAEDLRHVLSAEGRVRHDHVMLRDRAVLYHLDMDKTEGQLRHIHGK